MSFRAHNPRHNARVLRLEINFAFLAVGMEMYCDWTDSGSSLSSTFCERKIFGHNSLVRVGSHDVAFSPISANTTSYIPAPAARAGHWGDVRGGCEKRV